MNQTLSSAEKLIPVEDGLHVWTWSLGGSAAKQRPPLLVLHGGPGIGHAYLRNLSALASQSQRIIFYDQLGCGQSDRPSDPGYWTLTRFVREIDYVRDALQLDQIVLLGQSWGGMLAIEYLLQQPSGVCGAILSNSLASAPMWSGALEQLKMQLPPEHRAAIETGQASGDDRNPDYQQAVMAFYRRHVLRLNPFPDVIVQALEAPNPVYETLWGNNEFSVTGHLKDWDRMKDLHRIQTPVKLISGEFDESTPEQNQAMLDQLPHASWTLMADCSHLANLENPAAYLSIVQAFLDELTPQTSGGASGPSSTSGTSGK